jgi:hypothetical protein
MSDELVRTRTPGSTSDPMEIELVYNVRSCGTCTFFWPDPPSPLPYGPYPTFDVSVVQASTLPSDPSAVSFLWATATTKQPGFFDPEIMDGCRKAPIVTIGINPNLTAFRPGSRGASWCYPRFTSDGGADPWADFAAYYRYRSVYQEQFDPALVAGFLLPEGRVVAPKSGVVVTADRPTSSPSFDLHVRFDADSAETVIPLRANLGEPPWVVLFDQDGPNNQFSAGDVIAARLEVPTGQTTEIFRTQVGYYEQFVPTLNQFEAHLRSRGYNGRALDMGEDVGQLDMVACGSPHWTPDFLGGIDSEGEIVHNCVSSNAWALKQLVHTRPAVLYLVGEATYDMFRSAFGALIQRDPALASVPADGAFTMLRDTTDPSHPTFFDFATSIDGHDYRIHTRLVVTPHFSYSTNFAVQYRFSPERWQAIQDSAPEAARQLLSDPRLTYLQPAQPINFTAFLVNDETVITELEAASGPMLGELEAALYRPHQMMADVLIALEESGELGFGPAADGTGEVLQRVEGSCRFCVNDHWTFPAGCPYGNNTIDSPPPGFLAKVTDAIITAGRPTVGGEDIG